jgi:hypothetical protein
MKNTLVWLKGLGAAALGGAIAGVSQAATSGTVSVVNIKTAAISGAILTLGAYLTKSPIGGQH